MPSIIKAIEPRSPASLTRISVGEELVSVNGHKIIDVLDYKFRTYDSRLKIVTRRADGKFRLTSLAKRAGEELGVEFESALIDAPRSCANNCVFCFVDQLPRGMRETLYYKDDDTRLSFLQGNYVTLTNLSEREIRRIIDLRISPINVSVHSMNPELRAQMLGNPQGGEGVAVIRRLAAAGIVMNCQIVVCPGLNDGAELDRSIAELGSLYPEVASVSIVPVGLTKHREGLERLRPFDAAGAAVTIAQVEAAADFFLDSHGSRMFFCADELYIKAGLELPQDEEYEGYPQLENGVGLIRLLISEFDEALEAKAELLNVGQYSHGLYCDGSPHKLKEQSCMASCDEALETAELRGSAERFVAVTGRSAEVFIESLLGKLRKKCDNVDGTVIGVTNAFFGETVDVAGLVTGGDILLALADCAPFERLLVPRNMLRVGDERDGGVFLDDVTVGELERRLGVTVRVVEQDGGDLLDAMLGE